jgi:aminoglycoside phosphotransferase (APT) family kinase protein
MSRVTDEAGEQLAGNVGGAWRVGDTVRRSTGPWTPAVHALLDHLLQRLPQIPRVLGFDDQGREVLTYLPGHVVDVDREMLTRGQLRSVVTWTRRLHEAVAGFDHPGPWRFARVEGPTLIAHNDIAPYNICFDGDELVGVFDWDLAAPSTALLELAFIAWNCVPLWRDIGAPLAAERLELIASTYGTHSAREIVHAVPPRIQLMLDWIPRAAAAGDQGMVNLQAVGEPERSRRSLDDLVSRLPSIAALLA